MGCRPLLKLACMLSTVKALHFLGEWLSSNRHAPATYFALACPFRILIFHPASCCLCASIGQRASKGLSLFVIGEDHIKDVIDGIRYFLTKITRGVKGVSRLQIFNPHSWKCARTKCNKCMPTCLLHAQPQHEKFSQLHLLRLRRR